MLVLLLIEGTLVAFINVEGQPCIFGLLTTGFVEIPLLFITLLDDVATEFLKFCILSKYDSVQSVQSFQSITDGNDKNGLLLPIESSISNNNDESGLKVSAFGGNNPLSVVKYSVNGINPDDDEVVDSGDEVCSYCIASFA